MLEKTLDQTISFIVRFYDGYKYGHEGFEGYRKSTDFSKFTECVKELEKLGFIAPEQTVFADLGCADGRVNVLMSYFVKNSIGIEIDPDILSEFEPRRRDLSSQLQAQGLLTPPENIAVFQGSSLDHETYGRIERDTGVRFGAMDLFYTYITLHDLFGEKIAADARRGAFYLVYGFNKVLPRYQGLDLLIPDLASQGIAALYRKR